MKDEQMIVYGVLNARHRDALIKCADGLHHDYEGASDKNIAEAVAMLRGLDSFPALLQVPQSKSEQMNEIFGAYEEEFSGDVVVVVAFSHCEGEQS